MALLLQLSGAPLMFLAEVNAQPLEQSEFTPAPQASWLGEKLLDDGRQESSPDPGFEATSDIAALGADEPVFGADENLTNPPPAPSVVQSAGPGLAAGMTGPGFGGNRSPFNYATLWIPAQEVAGQATNLEILQQEMEFKYPLLLGETGMLALTGGLENAWFDTSAVLPDSGQPFPEELWRIRAGTQFVRRFDNGWTGMLGTSIGSSTDRPFGAMRDVLFNVIAVLSVPRGEHDAWNLFVFYAPTSEIPFPIPGVSYAWNPNESLRLNIGAPTSVSYRPTERLTVDASYMLLRTVHVQASYDVRERVSIYGAFDWDNESWFLSDRTNDDERLFSYDKRLAAGVRSRLGNYFALDVSAGYAFDRFYFTGENYDDRYHNRINVADGAFIAFQGGVTW